MTDAKTQHSSWGGASNGPAPLVPGTLRGYREWLSTPDGLTAISAKLLWQGPSERAICNAANMAGFGWTSHDDSETPADGCSCGLYARHKPNETRGTVFLKPGNRIPGVVEASGKIHVGREGFRAERMTIKALTVVQKITPVAVIKMSSGAWRVSFSHDFTPGDQYVELAPTFEGSLILAVMEAEALYRRRVATIQLLYPSVELFETLEDMLAKYPLEDVSALIPRPSDSPSETWNRAMLTPDLAQSIMRGANAQRDLLQQMADVISKAAALQRISWTGRQNGKRNRPY